ncbi:hypothetical protein [Corallococcus sp. 4LFB]|uniref:hypothetical protein n=1 Tax=Corallococcus sp. 4LFB TaxID=3383249 RepID=UPI0039753333
MRTAGPAGDLGEPGAQAHGRRQVRAFAEHGIRGQATELEPEANIQPLAWLVERTGEVLGRQATTPEVGDALREKVRKVRLFVGDAFGAKLTDGTRDLTTSRWPLDPELAQAVTDTLP